VQKAERRALVRRQAAPVPQRFLQQREGADDVGLDELAGPVDRAVDMAFGREIHHCVRLVCLEQFSQLVALADAGLLEGVARMAGRTEQRSEVGRIG
jgi:hypothetical protein